MRRFDERNTIFSRMNLEKGTEEYKEYYNQNPEKKEIDDELRDHPPLFSKNTLCYQKLSSELPLSTYNFLSDLKKFSEKKKSKENHKITDISTQKITQKLKELSKLYGADIVETTELNKDFYYSHRGRDPERFGEEIKNCYDYAIVFATEMDKEMIEEAPKIPEAIEASRGYVKTAIIGFILSYYIRELGFEARNHMDGNYLIPLTFLAEKSGIGEIGRLGVILTEEYGPRVRLGAVTTNLELNIENKEKETSLKEFCKECKICAEKCPADAISKSGSKEVEGYQIWKRDPEKCFKQWKKLGTDCGICIKQCPLS